MSSALVRQALELVDPEENGRRRSKKTKSSRPALGQAEHNHPYKSKRSNKPEKKPKSAEELAEENVRKLLALSQHTADPSLTQKIVSRAAAGRALADVIEVKKDDGKSILFADDDE